MLEPRQLKAQHSSLSMEMGRTAKDFGGQYSHDIRGHRFRMQFIQCNNWLDVVHVFAFFWGERLRTMVIFFYVRRRKVQHYKHCNRIWPFSFEDLWHIKTNTIATGVKSLQ